MYGFHAYISVTHAVVYSVLHRCARSCIGGGGGGGGGGTLQRPDSATLAAELEAELHRRAARKGKECTPS